ncbi:MAG: hypothetical protein HRT38_15505 [Alteromonadaceae bacterium]|nr:hypothetical protein [Alteromonadaceae bacterium]
MDEEFRAITAAAEKKLQVEDHNALNDAISGHKLDTPRHSALKIKHKQEEKLKKDRGKAWALAAKISAKYTKLYNAVMRDLDEAMPIIYNALGEANKKLDELKNRAKTLSDGTRIYKNNKDEVVSEDGLILSAADMSNIIWRGDEPTWEEFQETKNRHDQLELGFYRLGEIREIMEDDSFKKTPEMMEGFQGEVDSIVNIANSTPTHKIESKYEESEYTNQNNYKPTFDI